MRVRILTAVVALALLISPCALADAYGIDIHHSAVLFKVKHLGISFVYGQFVDSSGTFRFYADDYAKNSVRATINATSINTHNEQRDEHLRAPDFLGTEEFPQMTFVSTGCERTGDNQFDLTGDFSLHGVTKSITIPVTFLGVNEEMPGGDRAGFAAAFTIKRSDYGIDAFIGPAGDEVEIELAVEGIKVGETAEEVEPAPVGANVFDMALKNLRGETVLLKSLIEQKPTVLVFYRGGWCPYCNTQLSSLQEAKQALQGLGYQIVAVSPDTPEELAKSVEDQQLDYTLLSDSDLSLARFLGVAFIVDDETIEKYKGYDIDLLAASGGKSANMLPVPTVFVVDQEGVIRYVHSEPDYTKRLNAQELVAAAKEAQQ